MIVSTIKQFGLRLRADPEQIPFQYSANVQMKFEKDENFIDYAVVGYYIPPGESEAKLLNINDDGTFTLGPDCFKNRGTLSFSFNLVNSIEEVHLGSIDFDVRHAFGDSSAILPEPEEVWISVVTKVAEDAIKEDVELVQQKAKEALQSASLANDKASEAQEYANNANQSANSATLSASSALSAKNDAIVASGSAIKAKQDAEQSADNAKNSADTASANANKSNEAIKTVTQIKTEIENKANNFDTNYQEKLKSFNDNATSKQNAFDNSVQTANTNFDNKVNQANSDLDAKVQEANTIIDEKVKTATEQAQKATNEANRAEQALENKLDRNQGTENAGKTMVVDTDGNLVVGDSSSKNVYTKEEVDYMLADKMDKPYVPIKITDNATLNDCLAGNFKIDKIKGNTYQKIETDIVPTPERPVPINSRKALANGEYVELRSLKETINKFDLGLLSQIDLIPDIKTSYRKINVPMKLKPQVRYKFYYENFIIPALSWLVLNIVNSKGNIIFTAFNVDNSKSNEEIEITGKSVAFNAPADGEIYFSYYVQMYNSDGTGIPQSTEMFKENWFTKYVKNIMLTEDSLNQTAYVASTVRDYKIVDHTNKTSKIVRNVKQLDLSTSSYEYQNNMENKPYRIANYVYSLKGMKKSWIYIFAQNEKVYNYNGFQNQMENGLCVTDYGIYRIVNGVTNADELKKYVDNNHVDILYAVATPTEESIPYLEDDTSEVGLSWQDTTSPSPDIPSEIYEVDEINIKLVNNNIFSGELEAGAYLTSDGTKTIIPNEKRYRCKDFVKLPSSKISYQMASTLFPSTSFWILYYDADKKYLGTYNHFDTIPNNAEYITFYCVDGDAVSYINTDKIMIVPYHSGLLNKITDYVEAKETSIQHTLSKPLRATKDGSIADTIDIVNMQTTYNLKDGILDGTESWFGATNEKDNTLRFYTNKFMLLGDIASLCSVWCDKLPEKFKGNISGIQNDNTQSINCSNGTYIQVRINKIYADTTQKMKEFLQTNPFKIIYVTSNPTTEPLEDELVQKLKKLKTFSPVTHVFVEGIAKPTLNAKYPKDIAAAQAQLEQKVLLMSETLTSTQAKLLLQGGN